MTPSESPMATHVTTAGQNKGSVSLPEHAFGAPARPDVVYDALKCYLANQRQGNASTKTRSFVAGGGRKPWKQKGTGRARHGSIRSPIWVGGGTVFGPQPRDYSYHLPRKMRSLAMRTVMSDRARDGKVFVLDTPSLAAPKTKEMAALLKAMNLTGNKVLFIQEKADLNLYRSVRNLARAECTTLQQLNVYQLLEADVLIITSAALDGMKEVA